MKYIVLISFLLLFLSGCSFREREQALKDRELLLTQREQALLLWEQELQIKDAELKLLEHRLDSTMTDTTFVRNEALTGRWNAKMTCTETTCHGSAVGDSKTEVWDIHYDQQRVIANARDGSKISRIYTGRWTGSELELSEDVEVSSTQPTTQMFVRLTMTDSTTMDGLREIVRPGDCKITYSLQLKRP